MVNEKEIFKAKKEQLQQKYHYPDTQYSPELFLLIFEQIEMLEERIKILETKVNLK